MRDPSHPSVVGNQLKNKLPVWNHEYYKLSNSTQYEDSLRWIGNKNTGIKTNVSHTKELSHTQNDIIALASFYDRPEIR